MAREFKYLYTSAVAPSDKTHDRQQASGRRRFRFSAKVLVAGVVIAGIIVIFIQAQAPPEPIYEGKTASQWFVEGKPYSWIVDEGQPLLFASRLPHSPAVRAFLHMGKDAIPWLRSELPSWKKWRQPILMAPCATGQERLRVR